MVKLIPVGQPVNDAERSAMGPQQRIDVVDQPRVVSELEHGPHALGHVGKKRRQAIEIQFEVGRQLEQQRSTVRAEPPGTLAEERDFVAAVDEAALVRDAFGRLQDVLEPLGRLCARDPAFLPRSYRASTMCRWCC